MKFASKLCHINHKKREQDVDRQLLVESQPEIWQIFFKDDPHMNLDNNRMLLVLERALRDTNRAVINPEFEKLSVADLFPVLKLVARARVAYLKDFFAIASEYQDQLPPRERIATLHEYRLRFEELLSASQALETAISRNYLDVKM